MRPVAPGDRCGPGEALADQIHPGTRYVERHYRVRAVAEPVMTHDHPDARESPPLAQQAPEPFDDLRLGQSNPIRHPPRRGGAVSGNPSWMAAKRRRSDASSGGHRPRGGRCHSGDSLAAS